MHDADLTGAPNGNGFRGPARRSESGKSPKKNGSSGWTRTKRDESRATPEDSLGCRPRRRRGRLLGWTRTSNPPVNSLRLGFAPFRFLAALPMAAHVKTKAVGSYPIPPWWGGSPPGFGLPVWVMAVLKPQELPAPVSGTH